MNTKDSKSSNPNPTPRFSEGQKLAGCYGLKRRLPMTGDAEVWLAHDEVLGKDVSLHFVPQSMVGDSAAMTELRHEVKRNRQLIHPNILRVYDLVEENGWAAISMDAFEGESLASRMAAKNGVLDPADLQAWLAPLTATLDDAHKINVLHRDLAPGDLYLGKDGKLLITNFGLGRCITDAVARLSGKAPARLAARSPQQVSGATATRADDIYALGALVFQALSGRLPFVGDDLAGQVSKATPPTMASVRPQNAPKVGDAWEKAVASCLAKEAGDRPSSALALGSLPIEAASASAPVAAAAPEKAAKAEKSAKAEKEKAAPAPKPAKAAAKPAEPAKPAAKETIRETPKEPAKAVSETPAASPKTTTPDTSAPKKSVLETPIATSPERSRSPVLGLAIAAIVVGVVGYWLNSSKDVSTDEPPAGLTRTELPDGSDLRSVNNTVEAPTTKEEPVIPKAEPIAKVEPKTEPVIVPLKTEPAVAVPPNEVPKPTSVDVPPKPVAMQTPAPATPMLVAANATPVPVKPATPVPAKPAAATPAPAQGESEEDKVVAEKVAALEKAKQAAQAAEKTREGLAKQEKQAAAAVTEAQKTLDQKLKAVAPVKKEADEVLAQRKKLEDDQKAADEAAAKAQKAADEAVAKARQLAEEKAKATEAAKKAIADLEVKSKSKLTAQEKADAEVAALQKTLAEKQQIVTEANKSAGEVAADRAREQAAIKKGEEEVEQAKAVAAEARRAREEAEAERRRLAKELDDVQKIMEQKKAEIEARLKKLEGSKPTVAPPAPAPATPAPEMKPATPAPATPMPVNTPIPVKPAAAITPAPATPAPVAVVPKPATPVPATPAPATPAVVAATPVPATPMLVAKTTTPAPVPATPAPVPAKEEKNVNSLGMKFVPVGDVDFCIWQTRVKDFDVFAKAVNLKSSNWRGPGFKQGPDHPVVNVTWVEAIAFCKWLTDQEHASGALPADQFYRLPTDLEWSKAVGLGPENGKTPEARDMGEADVFPWGTQWPPPPNSGNYTGEETGSEVAIKGYDDGFAWTAPVGSFPPNKLGLYDMGGNVWQWCMDGWNADSKAKVLRGASWYNGALKLSLLSSCRVHASPDSSTDNYGFRIVRATDARQGSR